MGISKLPLAYLRFSFEKCAIQVFERAFIENISNRRTVGLYHIILYKFSHRALFLSKMLQGLGQVLRAEPSRILGLQPRDKAAMLGFKTIEVFSKNLHENRVWFPEKRNAFFLDHHQGRPYVTCNPAMKFPWALKSLTNISSVHNYYD